MNQRITSKRIDSLQTGEVFVFGSNLSGIHGAGAAKMALRWGAKYGIGVGLQGSTYALPTKDEKIRTLPIDRIAVFVDDLIEFAKNNTQLTFLVTEVGCGLAGLTPEEVAPLFKDAVDVENIHLPESFWRILV